jgi:hypothetical protein
VNVGEEMDFDATGEIEATVNGCFDDGDLLQANHRARMASCIRVNGLDFFTRIFG